MAESRRYRKSTTSLGPTFLLDAWRKASQEGGGAAASDESKAGQKLYRVDKCTVVAIVNGIDRLETRKMIRFSGDKERCRMLQAVLLAACGVRASPSECAQACAEAREMSKLVQSMDQHSRSLLLSEPYFLGGSENQAVSTAVTRSLAEYRTRQKRSWVDTGKDPFANFKFSMDPGSLDAWPRVACSGCGKRFKIYCPICRRVCPPPSASAPVLPRVQLPMRVEIVLHRQENIRKSTSIHLFLVSPGQCAVHKYPEELPDFDPKSTVLLFPDEKSVSIDDESIDPATIKRLVVVESTWQKARSVARNPKLARLRRVHIRQKEGTFWRHQELGNQFLSTLEATYHFMVEHWKATHARANADATEEKLTPYPGSYDDMMLVYAHQHRRIARIARGRGSAGPKHWVGQQKSAGQKNAGQVGNGEVVTPTSQPLKRRKLVGSPDDAQEHHQVDADRKC